MSKPKTVQLIEDDDLFGDQMFRDESARIAKAVRYWQHCLCLDLWKIDVNFHRQPLYVTFKDSSENSVARCLPRWEYLMAKIDFDCKETKALDDAELDYLVLHELCHCLVNEMRAAHDEDMPIRFRIDHEERVVTHLAKAYLTVFRQGKNEAPPAKAKK